MRYHIILLRDPDTGDWGVKVPALPGCYSAGETVEEALANVREAIALHVAALSEAGEPIPPDDDAALLATVDVPLPVAS